MKLNDLTEKEQNIYKNLERQVNSFFNKSNEKSFKTRDRYRDGMHDFAKFLAKTYRKENLSAIKNNHIEAYVKHLQSSPREYSTSYTTTNISAIRFFYARVSGGKFIIKYNSKLGVIPRTQAERIGSNRSMRGDNFNALCKAALDTNKPDYIKILQLADSFGLRLHEAFGLRKSQIRKAFKENVLEIKGKGGLKRYLPFDENGKKLLTELYQSNFTDTDRIFVGKNEKTHKKIKEFQKFIRNSRKSGTKSTYHSIRHSYAQKLYAELISKGLSDLESRKIVSERLGHHRIDITNVYLNK